MQFNYGVVVGRKKIKGLDSRDLYSSFDMHFLHLRSVSCENVLNLVNKSRLLFSLKNFGYSRVQSNDQTKSMIYCSIAFISHYVQPFLFVIFPRKYHFVFLFVFRSFSLTCKVQVYAYECVFIFLLGALSPRQFLFHLNICWCYCSCEFCVLSYFSIFFIVIGLEL